MAFSDYIVLPHVNDGGNQAWMGGDQGFETRHDSLANPLVNQGTHCRSLHAWHTPSFTTADKRYQWILDPAQQPNFTHLDDTKKVQASMWVRRVGGNNNACIGLGIKTGEGPQDDEPRGYLFMLGEGDFFPLTNTNALHMRSVDGTGAQQYNSGDLTVITADTWVQLLARVRPVRDGVGNVIGDEVQFYSNINELAPSWNLEDEQFWGDNVNFPPGSSAFRAWWNTPGYDATQFPSTGWHFFSSNAAGSGNDNNGANRAYISSFEMQVSSAFDPWPALP